MPIHTVYPCVSIFILIIFFYLGFCCLILVDQAILLKELFCCVIINVGGGWVIPVQLTLCILIVNELVARSRFWPSYVVIMCCNWCGPNWCQCHMCLNHSHRQQDLLIFQKLASVMGPFLFLSSYYTASISSFHRFMLFLSVDIYQARRTWPLLGRCRHCSGNYEAWGVSCGNTKLE